LSYDELKIAVEAATGLSRDALHIYAAVAAQLLAALLLRRSLAHPLPWLCALAVTVGDEWVEEGGSAIEVHDVLTAMLLPTLLLLLTRVAPALMAAREKG
jgi:hypothetical protein